MAFKEDFKDGKWPFGGEGGPGEVPVPTGAACIKISEILALADEHAGEYSFGGRADTLPPVPGLFVDEVGSVSVPLDQAQAEKLIAKCEKSPFGHNMDTKLDENVRKSWQLAPDQVDIKNPLWQTGIEKLSETIASRLGYKGVPLQCVLYKLLVYGEGGHFLKHQDTEKEDGMIATLVVQPPSTHEGGDLIVYRGGEVEHRHDFGKSDGSAPYFCHYAVHYADAEHALERVTKGFRLALVYSICLPASMRHLKRDPSRKLADDLADAIGAMGPEDESFVLLLSHEYTKKSIGDLGSGALKGVDNARFRALEEANSAVAADKKLRFFIAKLAVKVNNRLDEEGWGRWGREQAMLNFLNPGQETFMQLWKAYGNAEDVYTGNEGPIKSTRYSRFAIVAWPASRNLENVLSLMSAELAVEELLSRRPVDASTLRWFLDAVSARYALGPSNRVARKASLRFSRSFCELLLDASDADLAKRFFRDYCPRLGNLHGNDTIIPVIIKVVKAFAWGDVGEALLDVLGNRTGMFQYETPGDSEMELLLQVADAVDDAGARQDLIKMAAGKDLKLRTFNDVDMFWKNVILPSDAQVFKAMADKILKKEPSELGPFVECFSKYVDKRDTTGKFAVLEEIASKRMGWLKEEIERLDKFDKTFSWKMPYAEDPENPAIEEFLRGPEESMTTEDVKKFADIHDAKEFINSYKEENLYEASCNMQAVDGDEPFVTITKTREWFDNAQNKLARYRDELAKLTEHFNGPPKKARRD
ncbi:hypothetical protein PR003_g9775 [Phytophthora rubi]|uniref:Fe2OG dioxygenase domain-containing protein n=2 Tax=Phytophthora rubi TaxID=129364 RepID=A0A6A3N6F2_9STRA|nr:hypothetical protein PR001_g9085 [Phytophthora rubi]KAE9341849.1 hypothetical protein PR003_g9775 [Phytophthora rubi]